MLEKGISRLYSPQIHPHQHMSPAAGGVGGAAGGGGTCLRVDKQHFTRPRLVARRRQACSAWSSTAASSLQVEGLRVRCRIFGGYDWHDSPVQVLTDIECVCRQVCIHQQPCGCCLGKSKDDIFALTQGAPQSTQAVATHEIDDEFVAITATAITATSTQPRPQRQPSRSHPAIGSGADGSDGAWLAGGSGRDCQRWLQVYLGNISLKCSQHLV